MKPERGEYYYHFKHDPEKGTEDHLYKIIGTAVHSETDEISVIYQPLYELRFLDEKEVNYMSRPMKMWMEFVDRDEYSGPRFIKVEDEEFIGRLQKEFE